MPLTPSIKLSVSIEPTLLLSHSLTHSLTPSLSLLQELETTKAALLSTTRNAELTNSRLARELRTMKKALEVRDAEHTTIHST